MLFQGNSDRKILSHKNLFSCTKKNDLFEYTIWRGEGKNHSGLIIRANCHLLHIICPNEESGMIFVWRILSGGVYVFFRYGQISTTTKNPFSISFSSFVSNSIIKELIIQSCYVFFLFVFIFPLFIHSFLSIQKVALAFFLPKKIAANNKCNGHNHSQVLFVACT